MTNFFGPNTLNFQEECHEIAVLQHSCNIQISFAYFHIFCHPRCLLIWLHQTFLNISSTLPHAVITLERCLQIAVLFTINSIQTKESFHIFTLDWLHNCLLYNNGMFRAEWSWDLNTKWISNWATVLYFPNNTTFRDNNNSGLSF